MAPNRDRAAAAITGRLKNLAEDPGGPSADGLVVVLDTNVLDRLQLLHDPRAAALIFYAQQRKARIALPEIIRREWKEHFIQQCMKLEEQVRQQIGQIRTMFGSSELADSASELRRQVGGMDRRADRIFEERLGQLVHAGLMIEIPIADEHWREAGEMVIQKVPPNSDKSQQFKDCLLWQAVLDIGKLGPVMLVTGDNGFRQSGSDGLAENLRTMAASRMANVWIARDITDILEVLRPDPAELTRAVSELVADVQQRFAGRLDTMTWDAGWVTVKEPVHWEREVFATGTPGELAVTVQAIFDLKRLDSSDSMRDLRANISSSGLAVVHTDTGEIDITIDWAVAEADLEGLDGNRFLDFENDARVPRSDFGRSGRVIDSNRDLNM